MLLAAIVFMLQSVIAQTQSPVYLSQSIANNSVKSYYEYLPADYATSTKNYPLIIFVHGINQVGTGSVADLPKVLIYGLPKLISQGNFPSSFTSGGNDYSFIVISPQFASWPYGPMVDGVLSYVQSHYRIDPERIYLMGISAGGGAVEDYVSTSVANCNKIAAMIPMAGAMDPTQAKANIPAAAKLPVWLFHNTNDATISVQFSRKWFNYMSAYVPAPNPLPILTEFPVVSNDPIINHDSWTTPCNPTYKPNGINVYEWLLQYKRRIVVTNATPQANAGTDFGSLLPNNIVLNGTGSNDPDGAIVSYKWKKISGPSSYTFIDSTVVSPTVQNLAVGQYGFELTVTDNFGATSKDSVIAYIYPALPPGSQQRILIDVGSAASGGGVITSSPDINGNYWNNMTDARVGTRVNNAITTANLSTTMGLEVVNRIDGTYYVDATGTNVNSTSSIVGDYPASATKDYAYAHVSATNGKWRIKGLDPNKVYVIKFWGTKSGEVRDRDIEIKRSDEGLWKTYSAASNTNYNNAAVFNLTAVTQMDFDIRVKTNSVFGYISVIDITYAANTSIANLPPLAKAGTDVTIQLPLDSTTLNGCTSSDPENKPLKYKWNKISGPDTYLLTADTLCSLKIKNMVAGSYAFELMVTDDSLAVSKDTVAVLVNPLPPNQPPVAKAGNDITVQLPQDSVLLNGCISTDPENRPLKYKWNKLMGPDTYQLGDDTLCNLKVRNLVSGSYAFELIVTDDSLAVSKDTVAVLVNQPPVANAGSDASITLPTSLITVDAIASFDTDGFITNYNWRKISGPSGSAITTATAAQTNISFTTAGQYLFELAVTDNAGAIGRDSILINVNPDPNLPPVANAGTDQTIQLPVNKVFLDGRSSYDPNDVINTYQWSVVSGPAGSQLLTASRDTTSVTFGNAGTYILRLTVTDGGGLTGTDDVTVIVQPLPTTSKAIRVNIFDGTVPYNNSQWNNWKPVANVASNNYLYEDATASTVKAALSFQPGFSDNGVNYASTATICPPAVLRFNSIATISRTLTITGLNPALQYGFEFYASRAFAGNSTICKIGSKSDTISTDFNTNDYAKFSSIIPDNTGKVVVNLSSIGTYQYLAGFSIIETGTGGSGFAARDIGTLQSINEALRTKENTGIIATNSITVFPNPFANSMNVQLNDKAAGAYILSLSDVSGKELWNKRVYTSTGVYSETIDTRLLQKGFYILKLVNDRTRTVMKLIKL